MGQCCGVCTGEVSAEEYRELILSVISMYGSADEVLPRLEPICKKIGADAAFSELSSICDMIKKSPFASNIRLDFSVVNDMRYYNGIVFRGFLEGVCEGVLSGGEYSALMKKMGKRSGALGFAMYLDLLDELPEAAQSEDVDVLLLYNEGSDTDEVLLMKSNLMAKGQSVSMQREIPSKLRYGRLCDLRK
jgi:ATP phosphoribosyltransferase regulatory subunit